MTKSSIPLLFILLIISCSTPKEPPAIEINFLVGKWKHETKDQFEVWSQDKNGHLIGYSSRIKEGEEVIWENLGIKKRNGN
ncbi:MAG: hypothetical protein AAFU03_03015, partial [Bacteroidota bacterium]